jgi:hypothetical protein
MLYSLDPDDAVKWPTHVTFNFPIINPVFELSVLLEFVSELLSKVQQAIQPTYSGFVEQFPEPFTLVLLFSLLIFSTNVKYVLQISIFLLRLYHLALYVHTPSRMSPPALIRFY